MPAERSLYRTLERVGKYFPVLLDRHQNLVAKHGLVDPNQLINLPLFLRRKLSGRLKNVYPKNRFKFTVLSNVSPQSLSILGDFEIQRISKP